MGEHDARGARRGGSCAVIRSQSAGVLGAAHSSLGPATEAAVESALAGVAEGRTVITIAHRLSTGQRADRVAVMEHGRLVEVASHDELVEQGDRYACCGRRGKAGLAAR